MNRATFPLSLVLAVSLGSVGCMGSDEAAKAVAPLPATGVDVAAANPADCPQGGILVTSFVDSNGNGLLDDGERVLSTRPVCNGATGSQGRGAGIETAAAPAASCPAGGLLIATFVDLNNDSLRQEDETVTSSSTICNGVDGVDGSNGQDGQGSRITATLATAAQCPAGGTVYSVVNGADAPVQTIVCNGADGSDGSDAQWAAGPVGDMIPGQAYSDCHHDYLYVPGGARGWLLFRHQRNGSADQGIGATGFQVWNVDITDFLLASEVGNVTYCSLRWDPATLTLAYSVVSNADGRAGRTGIIRF